MKSSKTAASVEPWNERAKYHLGNMRAVSGTAGHDGSWLPAMVPCLMETSQSFGTRFAYHTQTHPRRPNGTTESLTGYVCRNLVNPHSVPLLSVEQPSSTNPPKQEPV